jgi:perosamine synthetase
LARLEQILARRDSIARRYCDLLAGMPGLVLPSTDVPGQRLSWFVFVVRLVEHLSEAHRDRLRESLAAAGIATGRYFAPIHQQPAYAAWQPATHLPVTEKTADRSLALPFFNRITDTQIQRVVTEMQAALRRL